MTMDSRMGSMGGFVTCANNSRKYSYGNLGAWARQASGASLPMDPSASFSSEAMGASRSVTCSYV